MSTNYPNDWIDGRQVPPLVITTDYVLSGRHEGTIHVESGQFELRGRLQGTLSLYPSSTAIISGTQAGTISIGAGVAVRVTGAIEGTTSVHRDAKLLIEEGGRLAGALQNDGVVIIRGVFGGPKSGRGELRLEGPGYIKQPRIRDGVSYYDW